MTSTISTICEQYGTTAHVETIERRETTETQSAGGPAPYSRDRLRSRVDNIVSNTTAEQNPTVGKSVPRHKVLPEREAILAAMLRTG